MAWGAPPQARGRRSRAQGVGPLSGSTPAGAGPTRCWSFRRRRRPEHPRRRGADARRVPLPPLSPGAPPQARGRPTGRSPRARPSREHPRRRGADIITRMSEAGAGGAPPQARGRRDFTDADAPTLRSTPAGAGPTAEPASRPWRRPEHPRRRGADNIGICRAFGHRGAPPQARGRPVVVHEAGAAPRSTPAGAGPTSRWGRGYGGRGEHPRRRGADSPHADRGSSAQGAPPQARGRPGGALLARCRGGSTPPARTDAPKDGR